MKNNTNEEYILRSGLCSSGTLSASNMQIRNSKHRGSCKCRVYSTVDYPWWMSMVFHQRGLAVALVGCTLHLVAAVGFEPTPPKRLVPKTSE